MDKISKGIARISKNPVASSMLKIGDIFVLAGLSTAGATVPGAVYELSKFGLGKVRDYIQKRDERRIDEFHKSLLYRDEVVDENVLAGEIEEANYHALLNACLSDIEDEKTTPYANLTRAIACGKVSHDLKRHFTLSLKEIAWEDLDFIRHAYVLANNEVIPSSGGGDVSAGDFLVKIPDESVRALSVKALTAKGFIIGRKITDIGNQFVEACSTGDELTPGVYGYRVWSGHNCDTYLLDQSNSAARVLEVLQENLKLKGIKCGGAPMEGSLTDRQKNIYATCAMIIYRRGKTLDFSKLENLKYKIGARPVIQIILDDDDLGEGEQLLSGDFVLINSADGQAGVKDAVNKLIVEVNTRHHGKANLKPS